MLWAAPATAPTPSPAWYCVFTAAWIWSQEYCRIAVSPPTAVWARAGAAAASTMASIAAINIIFLNSIYLLVDSFRYYLERTPRLPPYILTSPSQLDPRSLLNASPRARSVRVAVPDILTLLHKPVSI